MERDLQRGDLRTTTQRRWDALTGISRHYLETAPGDSRHGRPHVTVVVDLPELERSAEHVVATARADATHMGRLSRTTLELLACDCAISRVITDGASEVLDVGRVTRTVSPALWRALVVRDRCCRAPGCDRGPAFCEAHHVIHWLDGGPTALDNLQLLCHPHHRQHHLEHARLSAPP
jgi:hypothetical protein